MSVIVGSLQVDVTSGQATLTFDDAKRKLDDLGSHAAGASQKLDYSMREARESIMLTGESLGVHLPAGITRAIAAIGPLGPALQAAMPAVAVVAGIILIIAALEKLNAAAEKTKLAQMNAGSAVSESLRGLDDKFLQAGIKADELAGNHLAALQKQLKLIDNQTLGDLEHEFESLGKIAGTVLEDLKSHWYTAGSGSQHAKHNLDEYEATYRKLLDTKGEPAANVYLKQQATYEQSILDLQNKIVASKGTIDTDAKHAAIQADILKLKQAGTGYTEKEIQAQKELVDTLDAQVSATQKIDATAKLTKTTDTKGAVLKNLSEEEQLHKQVAAAVSAHESALRKLAETQNHEATGGREGLQAELAGIEANRSAAIQSADATLAEKQKSWNIEVAAAGQNATKIQEIENEHAAEQMAHNDTVNQADATAKAAIERAKLSFALAAIKQELEARTKAAQESLKIATTNASEEAQTQKAQVAQETADITNAEKLGLISKQQALQQTIEIIKQEGAERQAEIKKELADKQAALASQVAAEKTAAEALLGVNGGNKEDPSYKSYLQQINILLSEQDALTKKAGVDSVAALNQTDAQLLKTRTDLTLLANSWSTYFARMNSETMSLVTTMNGQLQQSITRFQSNFANAISQSIVESKSFTQAMRQAAAQFLESMLSSLIQWLERWIISHTIAAAFANSSAATVFSTQKAEAVSLAGANAVASFALAPWPIDMGAPAFGAAMAAAATGFHEGGIVPGAGNRDTVPAMLTPGEAVLPQPMVEKLSSASGTGGDHFHAHYNPTIHIKAWDSSDMKEALLSNKEEFMRHAAREARRRNR